MSFAVSTTELLLAIEATGDQINVFADSGFVCL